MSPTHPLPPSAMSAVGTWAERPESGGMPSTLPDPKTTSVATVIGPCGSPLERCRKADFPNRRQPDPDLPCLFALGLNGIPRNESGSSQTASTDARPLRISRSRTPRRPWSSRQQCGLFPRCRRATDTGPSRLQWLTSARPVRRRVRAVHPMTGLSRRRRR